MPTFRLITVAVLAFLVLYITRTSNSETPVINKIFDKPKSGERGSPSVISVSLTKVNHELNAIILVKNLTDREWILHGSLKGGFLQPKCIIYGKDHFEDKWKILDEMKILKGIEVRELRIKPSEHATIVCSILNVAGNIRLQYVKIAFENYETFPIPIELFQ